MRCWWWACAHEPTITHKRSKVVPFRNVYKSALLPVLHRRELVSPRISSLPALGSWLRRTTALRSLTTVDRISLFANHLRIGHRFVVARRSQIGSPIKNCRPIDLAQNGQCSSLKLSQQSTHSIRHSLGSLCSSLQRFGPTTTV